MFTYNGMDTLNMDLNNIKFEVTHYDEDDPDTVIFVTLLDWYIRFEKCKAFEKQISEELMRIVAS